MKQEKIPRTLSSIDADLPAGEMERILERIEENLAFRKVLKDGGGPGFELPAIPPLAGFDERHQGLRRLNAPFFVPEGRGLSALFRRLLNLPLSVLGHKQAQFNQQMIDLTTQLAASSHQSLTEQRNALLALSKEVEDLREQIRELRKQPDEPADES
jgi:hypothetical protein